MTTDSLKAAPEPVEAMRQACIAAVRAEQKYEGSDFPVCNAIVHAIKQIPALRASTDAAPVIGSGQGVISDAALDAILVDESPADDDAAFRTVWLQLEARGYLWSESNVEKAHLGWQLARALYVHPPVVDDEYMSVSISREGVVTSHNAFDANFDEMVDATQKIIAALTERYNNRLKCPFAAGKALREGDAQPVADAAVAGEGGLIRYDDPPFDRRFLAKAVANGFDPLTREYGPTGRKWVEAQWTDGRIVAWEGDGIANQQTIEIVAWSEIPEDHAALSHPAPAEPVTGPWASLALQSADDLERAARNVEARNMVDEASSMTVAATRIRKAFTAPAEPVGLREAFFPMDTWDKRDETVLLLVDYSDGGDHPLDDALQAITVGHNNDHNVGEDEGNGWQFAGWCWSHDHYVEGKGTPIGWVPLPHSLAALSTLTRTDEASAPAAEPVGMRDLARDFRQRANLCRTVPDAYDDKAAAIWDMAAEAAEAKA